MLEYNDVLDELQDYILNESRVNKSIKMKITKVKQSCEKVVPPKVTQSQTLFTPSQQDSLYWCFYIMKNGDYIYETIPNKTTLLAKQHKIELISSIRQNKDAVKTYKFDTIANIENNLVNEVNLNIKSFLTLCVIENINVIYVSNKTYYESIINDTDTIYIVRELPEKYHKKYGYELATMDGINNIRESHYKIENINKTIRSLASYKVCDLIEICNKLGIETIKKDTNKTKTKNDLYESIIQIL